MQIYHHHYQVFQWVRLMKNIYIYYSIELILDSIRSPTDRDAQFFDLNDLNRPTRSHSQSGNYERSRITQKPNLI